MWPWCFPDQPCARCSFPVSQLDAVGVFEVEQFTGREFGSWAHPDRETCRKNVVG